MLVASLLAGSLAKINSIDFFMVKWYIIVYADVAQLVEYRLPKPRVAGSRPVIRSK